MSRRVRDSALTGAAALMLFVALTAIRVQDDAALLPKPPALELALGPGARLGELAISWFRGRPEQALSLLAICTALSLLARWWIAAGPPVRTVAGIVARHRWFFASTAVATFGFGWVVTLGTWRLDEREVFGSFYDYQAASLLDGRLDVPEEAIGGEAFEARGKLYGYFGPTPALLRIPFVATGFAFGKLSRACMLAYFVASLVAAYLLLREGQRLARPVAAGPPEVDRPPPPLATCLLIASAGWGSTLLFLGSRGLIFHEAILGGIAFALLSCWCSVRLLRAPESRWWLGALGCGVLSIHTRPPTGLFALTFLGVVAVALAWREWRRGGVNGERPLGILRRIRRYLLIGGAVAGGTLSLNGLAYLKFGVFDPAPLHLSRPYANPERLAAIEGKSMHAANLPFNFYTYLIRPNFRLERGFPWIYLGSPQPGHYFPKAKIDLPDHTLALPYAMPSLFFLATVGSLAAVLTLPGLRTALATLWLAALPMTAALFAAVATAQRYTGDFCPLLIAATALALPVGWSKARWWCGLGRALAVAATLAAVAVSGALTLHYQGDSLWGVPEETRQNYRELRKSVDQLLGLAPP